MVAFTSQATNLEPGDTNAAADVFVRFGVFGNGTTTLVSRPENGILADGGSQHASIVRTPSGSGTYTVAFSTLADNVGADDENDFVQVYARRAGALILPPNPAFLVSRPDGTEPFRSGVNGSYLRAQARSTEAVDTMSADGRYTVFLSDADELSDEDDDRFTNVFRRDNLTGETLLVSRADGADGEAANATSAVIGGGLLLGPGLATAPSISGDGNRAVFTTLATNLVDGDGPGSDVFLRDIAAGTTVLASRRPDGSPIPVSSGDPALSGDGNRVAFVTTEQMDGDTNSDADVYLRDLAAATTQLVSRRGPAGPVGNDLSTQPALDFDGSHVAFQSEADDLDPPVADLNGDSDILVRDVSAGQTRTVSRTQAGTATPDDVSVAPSVSDDGNRVAFASRGSNIVSGAIDVNGATDIFVRDVAAATTVLASRTSGPAGVSGNSGSERPSIDGSGTRIAFETFASDLVPGDTNGTSDIAVYDTAAQALTLATRATGAAGAQLPEGGGTPSISGNGDCVAFETHADDVIAMPPGTDHSRVVARALRGDCPFGPVPAGPGEQPPPPPRRRPRTRSRRRSRTCD